MKRKRVMLLVIALLLIMVAGGVTVVTYSRYTSTASGTGTAKIAPWKVSVNDTDIVANKTFTIEDITWSTSNYIADDYIAPGRTGTFEIELDPTGSKVAMDYTITIDSSNITNDNITISGLSINGTAVTLTNGSYTGSISLADVEAGKTQKATVTITWTDYNTTSENADDTATGKTAGNISIPVTVTATQKVA